MSILLIRFARRLTSWEAETSDDEVLQTEFWDRHLGKPDLQLSVYEIDPKDIVQTFAEHATAFDPPTSTGGVDLGKTGRPVDDTPGATGFSFTMDAHRELRLRNRDDLLALVHEVRASLPTRTHPVTRVQVMKYARARLTEGDEEWERARSSTTARSWLKKVQF